MHEVFRTRLNYKPHFFILICAVIMASVFILDLKDEGIFGTSKQIMLLCLLSFLTLMVLYVRAKSLRVSISNQQIKIGKRIISFSEIAEIEIYSSVNFSIFANTEISTIKLMNGDKIRIYVENYSNGNLIRLNLHNLQQYLAGESDQFIVATKTIPEANYNTNEEDFTIYRHTAFKVIIFWAFFPFILIFAFLGFRGTGSLAGQIVVFGFSAGMFLLCVLQSRYFMVSQNFLVIKNYLMPWWSKTFHLSDIDHIRTFISLRGPSALNIVTTDFKLYRYPSGFLSLKMYDKLVTHIQKNKEALKSEATAQL